MAEIPSSFICSNNFDGIALPALPLDLYGRLRCLVDGVTYDEVWACDVEAGWIAVFEHDANGGAYIRDGVAASRIVTGKVVLGWAEGE